jgi:hypothetical protein
MTSIIHAVGFIVTSAIVVLVFIFAIADLAARLEFIQEKLPWLQRWLEKRSSVVYLLVVAIFLQVLFLSELKDKEISPIPAVSLPPFATIPAPIIHEEDRSIIQEVNRPTVAPVVRSEPSLRDRANKLANELQAFTEERDKHLPSYTESGTLTLEQRQAIEAPQRDYRQETYKLYDERFSVRVVTIVQEFKAMGVDVSQIESCAAYGLCPTMPIPIQLHALAARLDDNGNVRR